MEFLNAFFTQWLDLCIWKPCGFSEIAVWRHSIVQDYFNLMNKFTLGKTALIKVIWPTMNLHCPVVSGIILFGLFLSQHWEYINILTKQQRRKLSKEYFWFAGYLCLKILFKICLQIQEYLKGCDLIREVTPVFLHRLVLRMFHSLKESLLC